VSALPIKVRYAEITADGGIYLRLNEEVLPRKKKVYFTPGVLYMLAVEFGAIPPRGFNDFPGDVVVTEEGVFSNKNTEAAAKELPIIDAEVEAVQEPEKGNDGEAEKV
jgi:hypothetical protein